jgi:predicted O-methyltransferase YrrM|tara:strand:- start:140 stop:802 length:663 start_codon:yes stop_codon:yes gene_type:complete
VSVESPIISDDLREYVDSVGYSESNILKENRKETKKLGAISIMQIGAAQGALLSILCKISKFKNCLEVGVFTGYSSLCIGSSISDDSKLTCIDNNKEYLNVAKKYWEKAKIEHKINLIEDNAIDALSMLSKKDLNNFDFAFIDADKSNYCSYYEKIIPLMQKGGVVCIDNTLWKGRVYDNSINNNSTQSIRDINQLINSDKRVEHSLLTIYDGMTICYVK